MFHQHKKFKNECTKILTVCIVIFFNFSKSEGEFPHPVDPAAHTTGGEVHLRRGSRRPEQEARNLISPLILHITPPPKKKHFFKSISRSFLMPNIYIFFEVD